MRSDPATKKRPHPDWAPHDALSRVRDAFARDRRVHRAARRASRELVEAVLAARAGGLTDSEIAHAIVPATGDPASTNRARRKMSRALRERIRRARKATRRGAKQAGPSTIALSGSKGQVHDGSMYRKRTVIREEWRDVPPEQAPSELGDMEDVNADEELDHDLDDEALDDVDDDDDEDE